MATPRGDVMNEKQQIAEAERRFENWWKAEGEEQALKAKANIMFKEELEAVKQLLKEAWMNGAFVARENN